MVPATLSKKSSSATSPAARTAAGWPQGAGYRIEIKGEPSVKVELELSSEHGDHNHAGCLATAMQVLNAIPYVVAAPPGVITDLDLPVSRATGLLTR